MTKRTLLMTVVVATLGVASGARASAPPLIPLQGVLTDQDGVPINGTRSVRYSLHTAETGGTEVWYDTFSLDVVDGLFAAYLGSGTALPLTTFRDQGTLWLEAKVESDGPMARVRLGAAPYSGFAEYCGNVPAHTHPGTDITGTVPTTALPASVVQGAQSCPNATQVVRGVTAAGALACGTVAWSDLASPPTLVAVSQQCTNAGDKVYGIDAAGALLCAADQGVTGSGTAGNLALFTAAGAIGDAPITVASGVVTLPSGQATLAGAGPGSGLNADLLDGHHETAFERRPGNVLVVGTGPDADFGSIGAALAAVTNPSSTNPWLIKVGPGVYNERFTMRNYVDIEGAGIDITVVSAAGGATPQPAATVVGAYGTLRRLTITNNGSGQSFAVGLYTSSTATTTLDAVKLDVRSGANTHAVYLNGGNVRTYSSYVMALSGTTATYALFVSGSLARAVLVGTSVYADGAGGSAYAMYMANGIASSWSSWLEVTGNGSTNTAGAYMAGGTFTTSGGHIASFSGSQQMGLITSSGTVRIRGANVIGATNTVVAAGGTTYVTGGSLEGGAVASGGSTLLKCVGVSNSNGDPVTVGCL